VRSSPTGKQDRHSPVGRRVDNKKLLDMNAYLSQLQAPPGRKTEAALATAGAGHFKSACTGCHNADQSRPVPPMIVPMKEIFPAYAPVVLAKRAAPQTPMQDAPGVFDDKMIVIDASDTGQKRGVSLPLLLDLARTTLFLHDGSVKTLDSLLDPARGKDAPHPFYVEDSSKRAAVVAFLESLDAGAAGRPAP